jgi:signal peptidase I
MMDDPLFPAGSCCGRDRVHSPAAGVQRPLWLRLIVGRSLKRTLLRATIIGVCCVVVFKFALRPAWTDGKSMEPTIKDHRLHFINLLSYRWGEPRRHDIVAIGGTGRDFMFLKRVLALPGETVGFWDGQLYVDGRRIEEPYVKRGGHWNMRPFTLGEDEYYVAGDNRSMAMMLHVNGAAHRRFLEGKLVL